jgi:predicted nucleotidyltransferase
MNADVRDSPFVEVLYGSVARGDDDSLSDIDVLIIDDLAARQPTLGSATVVRYTWPEFKEMASYGSLFLRHLHSEGRIISADDNGRESYAEITRNLPQYERVQFDLESFELAISDSAHALACGDTSVEFELASLATVMRHCSILGSYLVGCDNFSRTGALDLCCDRLGLGIAPKDQFRQIYGYRISIARGLPFDESPTVADAWRSVSAARTILNGVREYASHTAVS